MIASAQYALHYQRDGYMGENTLYYFLCNWVDQFKNWAIGFANRFSMTWVLSLVTIAAMVHVSGHLPMA